ncbi:MAG TPA: DUF1896 family protein [Hanamia sp.]|nr:DUF1896 family protein [Hanamia sp.]
MKKNLANKLLEYIRENNPDLLFQLEEDRKVTEYIMDKISTVSALIRQIDNGEPAYIIEDACMDILTQDLRPSKFNYISNVLEEDFADTHHQLQESGTLKFEVINIIGLCQSVFEDLNFSEENEANQFLRYAIIGTIKEYFQAVAGENENGIDGVQQSTKTEG